MRRKLSSVYLDACLNMILSAKELTVVDHATKPQAGEREALTPTGSVREPSEEQTMMTVLGDKSYQVSETTHNESLLLSRGEAVYRDQKMPMPDTAAPAWDHVGAGLGEAELGRQLMQFNTQKDQLTAVNAQLQVEIQQLMLQLHQGQRTIGELTGWCNLLTIQGNNLRQHIARRDAMEIKRCCTGISVSTSELEQIIAVLCCRNRSQVSNINAQFFLLYGEQLVRIPAAVIR